MDYDYYTMEHKPLAGCGEPVFIIYGWGTYPRSSVLSGQPMKQFLDSFDTEKEAKERYPDATPSSRLLDPVVSLAHLPGEDDPVPGGMYPDDYYDERHDNDY